MTNAEKAKVETATEILTPLIVRIRELDNSTLEALQQLIGKPPRVLIVDYVQKFAPPGDPKVGVTAVMGALRRLAKLGWTVIGICATSRPSKDKSELSLTSFRDSSEIESNADSAYLLVDEGEVEKQKFVKLQKLIHAKNRHGPNVTSSLFLK